MVFLCPISGATRQRSPLRDAATVAHWCPAQDRCQRLKTSVGWGLGGDHSTVEEEADAVSDGQRTASALS